MALTLQNKWLTVTLITVACHLTTLGADFTIQCPSPCDCKWQSGNKAAICSDSNLRTIPTKLSNEIQNLELSGNPLKQLQQDVLKKAGLSNLKKLVMRDCQLETIHKTAFSSLGIIIEIDLSKNKLQFLHSETFRETEKLRWINLSNNLLEKLEDHLFRNLKFLQRVELSNNRLYRVGIRSFVNLPRLQILRLDGNNLTHIKLETLSSLNYLSSLDLHNNPWKCDCNLQRFRDWVMNNNLYTKPTSCRHPERLKDKLWIDIDSSKFACRPTILEPQSNTVVHSYEDNVTLVCKVVANPPPEVYWKFNTKLIETRNFGELKYIIADNTIDVIRWVNVTIVHVKFSDKGNYTCIAENPGGLDERNLTLQVDRIGSSNRVINNDTLAIIVGCLCSGFIIFAIFAFACLKRVRSKRVLKCDNMQTGGDEEVIGVDQDKFVIPVSKARRRSEVQPSITREANEVSDVNKTLLNGEIGAASSDEVVQSNEQAFGNISQETLLMDRLMQDFPPDLLSFPLRPPRTIIKQSGSPITAPAFYNYTNIQSGYVTLPRKPYRYSQGLSKLMMNRSELDLQQLPFHIPSFEELESAPSPAPATPKSLCFPKISSSSPNINNQLLALQTMPNYYQVVNARFSAPSKDLYIDELNGFVGTNGVFGKLPFRNTVKVRRKISEFEDLCLDNLGEKATQV